MEKTTLKQATAYFDLYTTIIKEMNKNPDLNPLTAAQIGMAAAIDNYAIVTINSPSPFNLPDNKVFKIPELVKAYNLFNNHRIVKETTESVFKVATSCVLEGRTLSYKELQDILKTVLEKSCGEKIPYEA